jgi:hypothetical protein
MHTIIFQINLYYRRRKYPCFRHTDISVTDNSNGIYNYRLELIRIKYYRLQIIIKPYGRWSDNLFHYKLD